MKPGIGSAMILVAALLGAAIAFGLYQWETADRARQAGFFPTSTPHPAEVVTPPPAGSGPGAGLAVATPTGDPTAGARAFDGRCNACHPNGNAGVGPAVNGPALSTKYPDDAPLRQLIRSGRGGMPGFPPSALPDPDLTELITYMRSLK